MVLVAACSDDGDDGVLPVDGTYAAEWTCGGDCPPDLYTPIPNEAFIDVPLGSLSWKHDGESVKGEEVSAVDGACIVVAASMASEWPREEYRVCGSEPATTTIAWKPPNRARCECGVVMTLTAPWP